LFYYILEQSSKTWN